MWQAVVSLPEDIESALAAGVPGGLPGPDAIRGVLVHSVDEGGIAGALTAAVAAEESRVPVLTATTFRLPACVRPGWLAVAVSWSGDDEETLAVAETADDAGAAVVAFTGGGSLARLAGERGWPVAPQVPAPFWAGGAGGGAGPGAGPGPRARLAALAVPPLLVLERLGLVQGVAPRLAAAAAHAAQRRGVLAAPGGPAAELARRIGRTMPVVHGPDGIAGVAAQRWKAAFNLNTKSPALAASLPDVCHDEIAGWGLGGDVTRQVLTLVLLRHDAEDPRLSRRFAMVDELMSEVVANVLEVRTEASDDLARFFELSLVGDLVSLLRAGQEGVDPGPVPALAEVTGGGESSR
jgi:glucose/mannose-6-phosphate isomerase